jgi:hypothetical protein
MVRLLGFVVPLFLFAVAGWVRVGLAELAPRSQPREWRSFVQREAGDWRVRWDERDSIPAMIRARSVEPLPGWELDHGQALGAFFTRNRELFGLQPGRDAFVKTDEREHRGVCHVRMRQFHQGVPVLGGEYMASVGRGGGLRMLAGRAMRVAGLDIRPAFGVEQAEALARASVPPAREAARAQVELAVQAQEQPAALVYVVTLLASATPYWWRIVVDAHTATVLETTDCLLRDGYTGVGRGFVADPNPEYALVDTTLLRLRDDASQLEGLYAKVLSFAGPAVSSADGHYYFQPCTTRYVPYPNPYDEVSAYWHTDDFLVRFLGPLGYTPPSPPLTVHVHMLATSAGLAFTTEGGTYFSQAIGLGCSAEDADIVDHECGHYVLLTFGIDGSGVRGKALEPLAMHEGYADYLAAAATNDECIGEFAYQHRAPGYGMLRCIATDPAEYNYARYDSVSMPCPIATVVHCRGMIWSGALWDLRAALPGLADELVVESLFYLPSPPCYALGYDALYEADYDLHGGAHADVIDSVFARRGIATAGVALLDVAVAGPAQVPLGQPGTYAVSVSRGSPPYHYAWSQYLPGRTSGGGWSPLSASGPEAEASSSTTMDFLVKCVVTDAGDRWGADSLQVAVLVAPLSVDVRTTVPVIWGGCARDTAFASGGIPPLACTWRRMDQDRSLLSTQPFVADSPVTSAHQLSVEVRDMVGREVQKTVTVVLPYGRPAAGIQCPSQLCCNAEPDTFRAVVRGGRPPYQYTWCQAAAGGPRAWTVAGEILAGAAIRRDSSFVIYLAARDADGVPSDTVSRAVSFCGSDSCRWQMGLWRGTQLSVATPVHASGAPVTLFAYLTDVAAARLELYDLTGRRLSDLARGTLRRGVNEVRWDCRGTRPGVYFVRLSANGVNAVRKVVVLP